MRVHIIFGELLYLRRIPMFCTDITRGRMLLVMKPLLNAGWYLLSYISIFTLLWRRNGRDGVSNHQPHDCLLNRLFRRREKTSKLRVTGLCEGNSPATGEFPAQRASNAENVSIWWRHHASQIRWYMLVAHCTIMYLPHISDCLLLCVCCDVNIRLSNSVIDSTLFNLVLLLYLNRLLSNQNSDFLYLIPCSARPVSVICQDVIH